MSRALLKSGLGLAMAVTAADRLMGRLTGTSSEPLIVGYHRVVETMALEQPTDTPAMAISVATLVEQLTWIGRRYRFVSLDEAGAHLAAGRTAPRRPVAAVTFDDGYASVYHHALPILMRMGIPAAMFVIANAVGSPALRTHDRLHLLLSRDWTRARQVLASLEGYQAALACRTPFEAMRTILATRPSHQIERLIARLEQETSPAGDAPEALRTVDWDMVSTMHRAGITIGSHTCDHPVLTNETPTVVMDELSRSRDILQQHLAAPVHHFAYPDGAFDDTVAAAVAAAGYQCAYTTCRHRDPVHPGLSLPRRFLWENSCRDATGRFSPSVMACLTNGVYDLASSCQRAHRALPARGMESRAPATRTVG